MIKIKDGIFSGFSEKLGNLVGMYLNGRYYLQTAPSYVNNPRSRPTAGVQNGVGVDWYSGEERICR